MVLRTILRILHSDFTFNRINAMQDAGAARRMHPLNPSQDNGAIQKKAHKIRIDDAQHPEVSTS